MRGTVELLTENMINLKRFILAALFLHFAWEQDEDGEWSRGRNGRPISVPKEALNIKRVDYFERVYLGAKDTIELFNKGEVTDTFRSNFRHSTLPQDKFFVIVGIQLRSATAAPTANYGDVAFDTVTENQLLNGLLDFEINGQKEVDRDPIESKFINGDAMPNFFRLPEPIVWEPNQNMTLRIKLPKAFDANHATEPVHKHIEAKLVGYLLEK
jgi:hypothetical protein